MPRLLPYDRSLDYSYALGVYPAMECLTRRPELCLRLLLHSRAQETEGLQKLRSLAEQAQVRIEQADRVIERVARKENVFAAMVFRKAQGILAEDLPHVVLHQPSDGGNVGTILRTCLAFGVLDIAVIGPAVDAFDPHTVRASMGALFGLRVAEFPSFGSYRTAYPEHGLFPFLLEGSVPLLEARAPEGRPYALVFGNEARGLPEEFAQMGQPVRIEQGEEVDSLNLAIAVALGVYTFARMKTDRGD